jgi:Bacterial Ig domain
VRGVLCVVLSAGFLLLAAAVLPATAAAGPGDVGFEGISHSRTSGDLTAEKPESKLWWNDGIWWASLHHDATRTYHIYRLNIANQTWVDTGVVLDNRPNTRADTLWDGTHLYVSSHVWAASGSASGAANATRLYRFSYNAGTDTYSLDSGFPVNINTVRSEALTIAKDSTGQLWATWTQSVTVAGVVRRQVYVNRTTGSDTAWGTPFQLPGSPNVANDDISAVVAFGGNKIGVMWSNQNTDTMSFAIHDDAALDGTWQAPVAALSGNNNADDHINLKTTADGRVFAAVKTSQTSGTATLLTLLVRNPANGSWSSHPFARKSENVTRPIVVIDEPGATVHVFFAREGGGPVYEKTSPLNNISFPTGFGPIVMRDTDPMEDEINNPTSTKQNVSATTDLVVAASNSFTKRYWHHYDPLGGGPPPNTAPTAQAGSASTTVDTPVTITLRGTDVQQCELNFAIASNPSNGTLGSIGNAACTPGSPNSDTATVTYTPTSGYDGPDSFTFTVNDGSLTSTPAAITITVNSTPTNTAPTALAGSASTTQNTPVAITLSGTDAEQCQLVFAIASSPTNGTLGSIGNQACTSGSPNTDTATVTYTPTTGYTGSDSFSFTVNDGSLTSSPATVTVTINPAGAGISFVAVASAANATATTLTIAAPAGVTPGHVLLAAVHVRGQPAITPPSGWVLVRQEQNGSNMRAAVYYKVATGSEPGSYTWTFASSQAAAGGITAWSGVSTTTPIDAHGGQVNASSNTITAPSITTTTANTMLVGFFGIGPATMLTPPAGMTERWDVASTQGSFKATSGAASALQAAAGATGTRSATSGATSTNIGQLVALRPA